MAHRTARYVDALDDHIIAHRKVDQLVAELAAIHAARDWVRLDQHISRLIAAVGKLDVVADEITAATDAAIRIDPDDVIKVEGQRRDLDRLRARVASLEAELAERHDQFVPVSTARALESQLADATECARRCRRDLQVARRRIAELEHADDLPTVDELPPPPLSLFDVLGSVA